MGRGAFQESLRGMNRLLIPRSFSYENVARRSVDRDGTLTATTNAGINALTVTEICRRRRRKVQKSKDFVYYSMLLRWSTALTAALVFIVRGLKDSTTAPSLSQ
ncbi:hypothetical protein GW17_00024460 [Ensete ventricosum]|nr:hypothetical protein GW17_00024460 [Ensete ventricosum]